MRRGEDELKVYCLPPTAYCLPPTAYCLPPTAYCLPPTAYCQLPTAYRQLPTAYRQLPTADRQVPPRFSVLLWRRNRSTGGNGRYRAASARRPAASWAEACRAASSRAGCR